MIVNVYIENFLFTSNRLTILNILNKVLSQKYNIKDLREVQTIIEWQITQNSATRILKIDQVVFIRDLVTEKGLTKCNRNVIFIKTGSFIKMIKFDNYEEIKHHPYYCFIDKLMYLICGTRPDIVFAVR